MLETSLYLKEGVIIDLLGKQDDTIVDNGITCFSFDSSILLLFTIDNSSDRIALNTNTQSMPPKREDTNL